MQGIRSRSYIALVKGYGICLYCDCAGVPLSPSLQYSVVNDSTLQISWDEPFTLNDFPIMAYNVTVDDLINQEEVVTHELSSATRSFTITQTDPSSCTNLLFSVVAVNDVGPSTPNRISAVLPSCESHAAFK